MAFSFKRLAINQNGRDFVIGDLHGCYDHFMALLEDINFDETKDRMFSVGDLIDRGPKSFECLKLIEKPWFHATIGNHEDMMLEDVKSGNFTDEYGWFRNGGKWAIPFLEKNDKEFYGLLHDVEILPWAITVETSLGLVGICHAESPHSWVEGESIDLHNMIWGRNKYRWAPGMGKVPAGINMTVHGHTPVGKTLVFHEKMNAFWIDTGCFATGVLTALQIHGEGVSNKPVAYKVYIPVNPLGWRDN